MKFAVLALVFVLVSCSTGYNREWKQVLAKTTGAAPRDLTGPWQGTWRSEARGNNGGLRCIVTREDGSSGRCRFHYHATYHKIFSATYDVYHVVRVHGGGFVFSGEQKLTGPGGGLYSYEGKGTPSQFSATFRSGSDHGVFELRRP